MYQKTINSNIVVSGVNVYTGTSCTATFHPAQEDSGLLFAARGKFIPARLDYASVSWKGISLRKDSSRIFLVEHLLSAVYALGIDNLVIELSGRTCPTVPNCAEEYFTALAPLILEQSKEKTTVQFSRNTPATLHAQRGPDVLCVQKADCFSIDYAAGYPHRAIGEQRFFTEINEKNYEQDIMAARSPAFLFNRLGLGLIRLLDRLKLTGITDENYLLITSKKNSEYANLADFGVRYVGQEFVRHKVLDVLGTLALIGPFVKTSFSFHKTGHAFDLWALRQLVTKGSFQFKRS